MTTIRSLLQNSNISRLDAEILLAHTITKPREYLLAHPSTSISPFKRLHFLYLVKKRAQGIPLAYLTGHKEFYGLNFFVNKHTLIPRPETETLVEETVKEIKKLRNEKIILIDIGTGSGCIPITILKTIQQCDNSTIEQLNIKTYATEISRGALRIAKKNASRHGVDIAFLHGNLLEPILIRFSELRTCLPDRQALNSELIITANLPYLTAAQFSDEPSIQHEPKIALVADDNGLALYEKLFEQVNFLVSQFPNFPVSLFLEINPSQSALITSYIRQLFLSVAIEIRKDLSGNDRVVSIDIPIYS